MYSEDVQFFLLSFDRGFDSHNALRLDESSNAASPWLPITAGILWNVTSPPLTLLFVQPTTQQTYTISDELARPRAPRDDKATRTVQHVF